MTTDKKLMTRTAEADQVAQTFGGITTDGLPATLAAALESLARLAVEMKPDDIHLMLDLPAGILNFRAYRRPQERTS